MPSGLQPRREEAPAAVPGRVWALLSVVLLLDGFLAVPMLEQWRAGSLHHGLLLFLLPFHLFALGWVLELVSRCTLGRSLEPEGLSFGRDEAIEWAEFHRLGPIKFALGLLFALAFVLMFFAFRVSNESLARVWPVLLSLAVGLWLGKAVFNRRRSRRYLYSAVKDLLTLPGGEQLVASTLNLRIEEIQSPRGDRVRCRPVLLVCDDGRTRHIHLPWSFGRETSEQFADWWTSRCGQAAERALL